jgi:hypothetical protein
MLRISKRVVSTVAGGAVALVSVAFYVVPDQALPGAGTDVSVRVRRDTFELVVMTAGELKAKNHVEIKGPPEAQLAQIYGLKITSIVPEGTLVKEGDIVAELDRAPIGTKSAEVGLALTKAMALAEQAQLDTALNLAMAREALRTLATTLEEKRIAKEQSIYEPPSVRRQAELEYEKTERMLKQDSANYLTKVKQAQAKMREVATDVTRQRTLMDRVERVQDAFTIRAPAPGMVIYYREYNGRKRGVGSQVSSYDPIIATLPDLSLMQSLTYVNELDVRKLAVGQAVTVSLDADPTRALPARVTQVANVGEQRPNVDAKVFEVIITMEVSDTTLRPGMTTSNAIEAIVMPDVLVIPLEAVVSEGETPYVYKRAGGRIVRQQIAAGPLNDDEIVVHAGLAEGDEVLLTVPSDAEGIETLALPSMPPEAGGDTATPVTIPPRLDSVPPQGAKPAPPSR